MTHFPLGTCNTAQTCPGCTLELDTDSCGPSLSRRREGNSGQCSVLARGSSPPQVTRCLTPCLRQLQDRGAPQPGQGRRGGLGLARGASAIGRSILRASHFLPIVGPEPAQQRKLVQVLPLEVETCCSRAKCQDETALLCESPYGETLARKLLQAVAASFLALSAAL